MLAALVNLWTFIEGCGQEVEMNKEWRPVSKADSFNYPMWKPSHNQQNRK
jgi:hypothetical protein